MKKVICIYTNFGGGLPNMIEKEFKSVVGDDLKVMHIGSSEILGDVIGAGGLNDATAEKISKLYDYAVLTDADVVVCTCSSIGKTAETAAKKYPNKKIIRIDEPMCRKVLDKYTKIGILATLPTTCAPSGKLVEQLAEEQGKKVNVSYKVAEGAFQAMIGGDLEKSMKITMDAAKELAKDCEAIILAQASMMAMEKDIAESTGLPVFSSVMPCADFIKQLNK